MADAADGAVKSGPLNEDLSKLLKKLGYPDIHDTSKPSALIEKAIQACTRRSAKLAQMLPAREQPKGEEAAAAAEGQTSELQEKPCSQHSDDIAVFKFILLHTFIAQDVCKDPCCLQCCGCLLREATEVQG